MAVIGEFRSDLSITRKNDGNFGNVAVGVFVFQSRISTKMVVTRKPFIAPAGFWPRGQNPRRHLGVPA